MTPLRAVIVDDEPIARQALNRLLSEFPQVRVCGEADCVEQAAAMIWERRPDIVYLDIELFGESGFDLVPQLDEQVALVFVTAFNRYAIRAFEVNALDYLLKPVTRERLAESITRLCEQGPPPTARSEPRRLDINDLILVHNQVHNQKRRHLIPLREIGVIEAKGDLTVLRSIDGRSGVTRRRMHEWAQILPEKPFIRTHRSLFVNGDHIDSYEPAPGGQLRLFVTGIPEPVNASRRRAPAIRKILKTGPFQIQP